MVVDDKIMADGGGFPTCKQNRERCISLLVIMLDVVLEFGISLFWTFAER